MNTLLLIRTFTVASTVALPILAGWSGSAHATGRDDQWYIGFGGTGAFLEPDPEQPGNNTDDSGSGGGTFMVGKDLDERSSIQLQGFSLGEAVLDDGNTVEFDAVDASIVYRFFDTRDNNFSQSVFGTAFYGRFGLGFATRDSDTELEREDEVYFGAGAGFETYFHQNVAIRGEAFFHDIDAVSGSLSLVFRFGGTQRIPGGLVPPTPSTSRFPTAPSASDAPGTPRSPIGQPRAPSVPEVQAIPIPPITANSPTVPSIPTRPAQPIGSQAPAGIDDGDRDGIANDVDDCPSSELGFPVRANGCPLFDGVLSGLKFVEGSEELAPGSEAQLNFLAGLLVSEYPGARVELHSHTDNEGDVRSQAILTRGRLKTVGMFLIDKGVRANRLILRSFGGSRPLFDNATPEGRASNNRFEILERPR